MIYRDIEVWFCDSGDVIIVKPGQRPMQTSKNWMRPIAVGDTKTSVRTVNIKANILSIRRYGFVTLVMFIAKPWQVWPSN